MTYTNEQLKQAANHLAVAVWNLEDRITRGVGNTVMLLHYTPGILQDAGSDGTKWRVTVDIYKNQLLEAYALYLERVTLWAEAERLDATK
jgi:hypothetical protein